MDWTKIVRKIKVFNAKGVMGTDSLFVVSCWPFNIIGQIFSSLGFPIKLFRLTAVV